MAESRIANDDEEQSFLKMLTSHLPTSWSDEQRDAYLQRVLANWRLKREHTREEQRLLENYKDTIKQHFQPLSPELYDFQHWPIDKDLTAMLERGSLDPSFVQEVQASGMYTFSFLPPSFCRSLIEEVEYFERWCVDNGLKIHRPNSMNNYGVILDHFGFEQCLTDVITHVVEPLTRLLYRHVTLPLDSHHGFIVEYAMNKDRKLDFHVDDSAVTLNLCLGAEFTDGQLYFGGVRCSSHVSATAPRADEEIILKHQIGTACLHLGQHRHRALPITTGRRLNLILWCRSSNFDRDLEHNGRDECPSWCGYHQRALEHSTS